MEYYPTLVEAAVEFRIVSRILLGEQNSKHSGVTKWHIDTPYVLNPAHETVPLANGYRITKDPKTGNYYCLKDGQTRKQ